MENRESDRLNDFKTITVPMLYAIVPTSAVVMY